MANVDMSSSLEPVAGERMIYLTTLGRRSRKKRTTQVWFVIDGSRIVVQAGPKGVKGWYANIRAEPRVSVAFAHRELEGEARPVTDAAECERLLGLFQRKYWLARLARWVGARIGAGKPVAIAATSPLRDRL